MTDRQSSAMQIVYRYMAASAGAALVPVPGMDIVLLAGVHVALIKRLCEHYHVDFSENTARNLLVAIAASIIPGTIGSITWLARHQEQLAAIRHGLVLTGLGGPGPFVYYEIWLQTFEDLLAGRGLVTGPELDETTYQFEFGERDDVF